MKKLCVICSSRLRHGKTFCSKRCMGVGRIGKNNPFFGRSIRNELGGGEETRGDHKRIWDNVKGRKVMEHREIIEEFIGRNLSKDEVVHHINFDKSDNRKENLVVMTRSDHMRLHWKVIKSK